MGRTLPPYSRLIENFESRLAAFRRALRAEDKEAFDELMLSLKRHVQAGVYASFINPTEAALFSALLEMQKQLLRQQQEIKKLQDKIATLPKDLS
ncbi:MAG: hypothetical protein D6767_03120 [Candidatus Hydrogenedentota bacterium]|nr:MAG: hypothetical protein D6767_03120 [Candidatus Hydrogenedentota bacterium]